MCHALFDCLVWWCCLVVHGNLMCITCIGMVALQCLEMLGMCEIVCIALKRKQLVDCLVE